MTDITLTFPDGNQRPAKRGISGRELAAAISKSLAKKAVAMLVDGRLADLADPIVADASVKILSRTDPEALELIRHDCAHVMAEAVQALWPGTQVTIGPVIENGFFYDFAKEEPFHPDDLARIEAKMHEIIARNAPFTKELWSRERRQGLSSRARASSTRSSWSMRFPEGEDLKIYKQGEWLDLCRGPHMTETGQIGKAFKLTHFAGSYWRGDAQGAEAAARLRHRLGERGRACSLPEADRGGREARPPQARARDGPLPLPGGGAWRRLLAPEGLGAVPGPHQLHRRRQSAAGYREVNSPQILDKSLWETSGHWEWYREHMFSSVTEDEREFAIKPMNCPGHVQIFKHGLRSYRELPYRVAEFGMVHRYEPSGALHGLMRVRGFTQDDAHVFCTEEQLAGECIGMNELIMSIYRDFGFEQVLVKLATRPEKRVGSDALWDHAESTMSKVLQKIAAESGGKIRTGVNPGEGTFYGPKFEYVLRDAIGRDWQCGTTQVDFNLPERFGAFYIDADGEKKTPVMIHRAMFGSMERFAGILLESTAGHLPLWLAPVQAKVCTIVSDADPYAEELLAGLQRAGLRAEADLRNEKINYKVREHLLAKVPVLLVVGKREAEEKTVSLRRLGVQQSQVMPLDKAIAMLADEAVPPDLRRTRRPAAAA